MNVFVLDMDLQKCAEYHTDKHVVKMITETAQLLSSAYYNTNEERIAPYRLSHNNHPWAVWTRTSLSNWMWLSDLGMHLYDEYRYRYGDKHHRGGDMICYMVNFPPTLTDLGMTKMPQCMPEDCKCANTVCAYREYYNKYKTHLFEWTGRDVPKWVKGEAMRDTLYPEYGEILSKATESMIRYDSPDGKQTVLLSVVNETDRNFILMTDVDLESEKANIYYYDTQAGEVSIRLCNGKPMTEEEYTTFVGVLIHTMEETYGRRTV